MIKKIILLIILGIISSMGYGQNAYFVDGYHGGIYGHYPLWNTQFYVDKLSEFPEWKICLEIEPETWDIAYKETPEAYAKFKKIASSSRIEFVNATLSQPYMYNISGESIIRQLAHGAERLKKHFPEVKLTTYSAEEPCFTSCLPQILKSFGYKYAVLKSPNTCWGGYTTAYGGELVNWVGPDGTKLLTVPRYACEKLGNNVWTTIANDNSDEYLEACKKAGIIHPVGMCFQDAGWNNGPWLGTGDNVKNNSVYQTWRGYIEDITSGGTTDDWDFTQENIQPGLVWGSQVLQQIAQQVRASENNLIMAEKINAMNYILEGDLTADSILRDAWYSLALSQHHDSWIVPYNKLPQGKTWAQAVSQWTKKTDSIAQKIMNYKQGRDSDQSVNTIRVTNTTSVVREELVETVFPLDYASKNLHLIDENNNSIPIHKTIKNNELHIQFMATVPSFGFSIYRIKHSNEIPEQKMGTTCHSYYTKGADEYVIENDLYKITIDLSAGGTIKSLIAKQMKQKEFLQESSTFKFGELRGFFYEENQFRSNATHKASIGRVEKTFNQISVEVKSQIGEHPVSQFITLNHGDYKINCSLEIDWKDNPGIGEFKAKDVWGANHRPFYNDRYKLLLLFPTVLNEQDVYKNAPFDVCKSSLENTFYSTWDSIKHNIILNWVDFVEKNNKYGLALLSDHTTSYTHGNDFPAGLTIQYSGIGLWNKTYSITEKTHINYALIPHEGLWDKAGLWTESIKWNEPLLVHTYTNNLTEQGRSLISLNKKGYEITTVEIKDHNLYVRLFNAEADHTPVKINVAFEVNKIEEVELDGSVIETLQAKTTDKGKSIAVKIPRFGLKTFKISQ